MKTYLAYWMKILFPTFPIEDIFSFIYVTFFYKFPLELHITSNSQYLISIYLVHVLSLTLLLV